MDKPEILNDDKNDNSRNLWKQDEIFDTIWNNKIDKFFENYKKFDELWLLVCKNDKVLIYSDHVLLDSEVSWRLHSDFYETFLRSIESLVWEDMFKRMWIFFDEKNYLLSTDMKRHDGDPFLDDNFKTVTLWDKTVAQFIERRNTFNNVEFHYIVYPERIFKFVNELLNR